MDIIPAFEAVVPGSNPGGGTQNKGGRCGAFYEYYFVSMPGFENERGVPIEHDGSRE